jgi:hypothetical protein
MQTIIRLSSLHANLQISISSGDSGIRDMNTVKCGNESTQGIAKPRKQEHYTTLNIKKTT